MPVLVLTARGSWHEKVQGIDGGADDYVAKPFRMEEVLARLRALIRRAQRPGDGRSCAAARSRSIRGRRGSRWTAQPVKLTSHEFRVLSYLMHHRGRVVSQGRADRAHLRAGLRSRLEHGRGVHRAAAPQARRAFIETVRGLGYRMASRVDAGERREVAASLRARLLLGAVLLDPRVSWPSGSLTITTSIRASRLAAHHARRRVRAPACRPGARRRSAWSADSSPVRSGLFAVAAAAARLAAVQRGPRAAARRRRIPPKCSRSSTISTRCSTHRERGGAARARQGRRSRARAEDAARGAVAGSGARRRRGASRSGRRRSVSRSSGCGGRSTITWRTRARRRPARRLARAARSLASAEALARTLLRLHADRGLTIDVDVSAATTRSACQREDLDEMLGNLLDNACKWAKSRVDRRVIVARRPRS